MWEIDIGIYKLWLSLCVSTYKENSYYVSDIYITAVIPSVVDSYVMLYDDTKYINHTAVVTPAAFRHYIFYLFFIDSNTGPYRGRQGSSNQGLLNPKYQNKITDKNIWVC